MDWSFFPAVVRFEQSQTICLYFIQHTSLPKPLESQVEKKQQFQRLVVVVNEFLQIEINGQLFT